MSVSPAEQRRVAEQIAETKRIAIAIRHALSDAAAPAVMITSALPGEGKSLVSSGVASAAALSGDKVLVVDLNWHRPGLHNWFGMEPWFDLDALKGADVLSNLIRPSGVDNLDLLAAPKAIQSMAAMNGHTSELAASIIGQARNAYDFIVLDASPVFPTNRSMMDPVAVSGLCDGVSLVALTHSTPRQQIKRAQKVLETAGARILGVVLNQRS